MLRARRSALTPVAWRWLSFVAMLVVLGLARTTVAHAAGSHAGAVLVVAQAAGSPSSMTGLWIVNPYPDNPTARELALLTSDGFMFSSNSPTMPAAQGEAPPGVSRLFNSQGFGVWQAQPNGTVAFNFLEITYDPDGDYLGTTSIHGTLSLGPSANSFSGSYTVTVTLPDGTSMDGEGPTPVTGTRAGLS